MKKKKVLLGLMMMLPLSLNSCSTAVNYDYALKWVSTHYTEIVDNPWPAIATFTWDYHGTVGDKAMAEVENIINNELQKIEQFKDVIYFTADKLIGKRIIVYHTLQITPLTEDNFAQYYPPEDEALFRIYNNRLSVTTPYKAGDHDYDKGDLIHVYNNDGFLRGLGFKIGYGFMEKGQIIKLKVIIELTYEDD